MDMMIIKILKTKAIIAFYGTNNKENKKCLNLIRYDFKFMQIKSNL